MDPTRYKPSINSVRALGAVAVTDYLNADSEVGEQIAKGFHPGPITRLRHLIVRLLSGRPSNPTDH